MMGIKEQLQDLEDKVSKGLRLSYAKLLEYKKQKNSPLIVSKDGVIVQIKVDDSKLK